MVPYYKTIKENYIAWWEEYMFYIGDAFGIARVFYWNFPVISYF